ADRLDEADGGQGPRPCRGQEVHLVLEMGRAVRRAGRVSREEKQRLGGGWEETAVGTCRGWVQVPGVVPLVQPRPPTLPAALSQPPLYQAQGTPASDSSSPMFFAAEVSSTRRRRASGVPGAYGWKNG